MVSNGDDWWTDEKVEATMTKHYIYSHLKANEAGQLSHSVFTELSDDTYLQWILTKVKRLFLILVDIGIQGHIFRLIDESYDDDDLPIAEDDVPSLRLPRHRVQNIDKQFYRHQFRYIIRVVGEGEHIRYATAECVPIQSMESKGLKLNRSLGRVWVPSPVNKTFMRKCLRLDENRSEDDVLADIVAVKVLNHEHVLSVFGSYSQDDCVHIIMLPSIRYNLKDFLSNTPKTFEVLPKVERRKLLLSWPHCLSTGLAWLHYHGMNHGAVRPSRVSLDEHFQISLGEFEGDSALGSATPKKDLESYQYAAPEHWKRGLTVQAQTIARVPSLSGGRTSFGRLAPTRNTSENSASGNHRHTRTTSTDLLANNNYAFIPTSKGNSSRLKLEVASELSSTHSVIGRRLDNRLQCRDGTILRHTSPQQPLHRRFDGVSLSSLDSSNDGNRLTGNRADRIYSIPGEAKNAVVQTWKSAARDRPAADVFGLAAVTMDILTVMCGRTISAFTKHRASRQRQAGRGGGLADSSFHANLAQVGSWAEALHRESEKKIKKDGGKLFCAVGPILQVLMQCLDREPEKRMQAVPLSKALQMRMAEFAGIQDIHCSLKMPTPNISRVDTRFEMTQPDSLRCSRRTGMADEASRGCDSPASRLIPRDMAVSASGFREDESIISRPSTTWASSSAPQPLSTTQCSSPTLISRFDIEGHDDQHDPDIQPQWIGPNSAEGRIRLRKDFIAGIHLDKAEPITLDHLMDADAETTSNDDIYRHETLDHHTVGHVLSPTSSRRYLPPYRTSSAVPTNTPRLESQIMKQQFRPLSNVDKANDLLAEVLAVSHDVHPLRTSYLP